MSDEQFHADYPSEALWAVLAYANRRFEEELDEHGPGQNWLDDHAPPQEWHFEKIRHHVNRAEIAAKKGEIEIAFNRLGDAQNHKAMVAATIREDDLNGD